MTVLVLGINGMLGRYVYQYFQSEGYKVEGTTRQDLDAVEADEEFLNDYLQDFEPGDVIINCIGTIKPMVDKLGDVNAIYVNSLFPHILAGVCEKRKLELIHITTDCVFSGKDGRYTEKSPHDCTDVYGKTKSLGEPENCTVVRTSIIGEEVGQGRSLIEWVKSEDGNTVNGYLNHQWNGLTCYQTAKVFEQIVDDILFWKGVRHIHSPDSVNKHELVRDIAKAHNLNVEVKPVDGPSKCDRTLSTSVFDEDTLKPFYMKFNIPNIYDQLVEQANNPPKI